MGSGKLEIGYFTLIWVVKSPWSISWNDAINYLTKPPFWQPHVPPSLQGDVENLLSRPITAHILHIQIERLQFLESCLVCFVFCFIFETILLPFLFSWNSKNISRTKISILVYWSPASSVLAPLLSSCPVLSSSFLCWLLLLPVPLLLPCPPCPPACPPVPLL